MAARKSGESLVYKRLKKPVINELDPTDNPSAGDLWIDISQSPPILNMLDATLNAISISSTLTPPVTITGANPQSTTVLTLVQVDPSPSVSPSLLQFTTPDANNQQILRVGQSSFPNLVRLNAGGQLWITPNQGLTGNTVVISSGGASTSGLLILRQTGTAPTSLFQIGTAASTFGVADVGPTLFKIDGTGAVSVTPNTQATGTVSLLVNAPTGQTAGLLQVQTNGSDRLTLSQAGALVVSNSGTAVPLTINSTNSPAQVISLTITAGFTGSIVNATVGGTSVYIVDQHGNITLGDGTAAPTVGAGQLGLGGTTATSASAGVNGAVPAQVVGYLIVNIGGTSRKIPFFAT